MNLCAAASAAAAARPELARPAARLASQCKIFETARGGTPAGAAVAAYAALAWLHTPWLRPYLQAGELALIQGSEVSSKTESGSTGTSGPAHSDPHFARFVGAGASPVAPAGLANPVTLGAMGTAGVSGRASVVDRPSYREFSHCNPRPTDGAASSPAPDVGSRPSGDSNCPIALWWASPFFNQIVDHKTRKQVESLSYGLPPIVLSKQADAIPSGPGRDAALATPVMRVVHADMIYRQHMSIPCRACAQGWCPIREYALVAAKCVLPFHVGLRPSSQVPFRPRAVAFGGAAVAELIHAEGMQIIYKELGAGISRPARPGEEFVVTCNAFVAYKAYFHPDADTLEQLARNGQIAEHAAALAARMMPQLVSAAAGKASISSRDFNAVISSFVTSRKARLVHDHRVLNQFLAGWKMRFPFFDEILSLIQPGGYITLRDWLSGFSNQASLPENDKYLAYNFAGCTFVKTVEAFGLMNACPNFALLSAEATAVAWRIIRSRPELVAAGAGTSTHVDDQVGTALTKEACDQVGSIIDQVIKGTGGNVNDKKTLPPSQQQVVHGVLINTADCTLSITLDKCYNYIVLMMIVLALDAAGISAPIDTLFKVVGRNTYVAGMLHGARLELGPQHRELQSKIERIRERERPEPLSTAARLSLEYFVKALGSKGGGVTPLSISPAASAAPGGVTFRSDSSGDNDKGFGGVLGPVALHGRFAIDCPDIGVFTILARELLSLYFVLAQFGPLLAGLTLRFGTDNDGLRSCIGTGFTADASCAPILRAILAMSAKHEIIILTSHYYREDNTVSDDISKSITFEAFLASLRPLKGYVFAV